MSERIQTSPKKGSVTPRTVGQKEIRGCHPASRCHLRDPARLGPGKTYLAMAMAVATLKEEKVARIYSHASGGRGGWQRLGFLPGDLYEKITPYLWPLHDALQDMLPAEEIQKQMERNVIDSCFPSFA